MADKSSDSPVRIIGSRELHQNLPGILKELENDNVRYVLTVHGRPRAVLIGAEPYLTMITDGRRSSEALVGLQLTALLGGSLDRSISTISKRPSIRKSARDARSSRSVILIDRLSVRFHERRFVSSAALECTRTRREVPRSR